MTDHAFGDLLVSFGFVTNDQLAEAIARDPSGGDQVGEVLLELGYVTSKQLKKMLAIAVPSGGGPRAPLGEVLVERAHLTPATLTAALDAQRADPRPLGELLVDRGEATYAQICDALASQRTPAPARARTRVLLVDDSPIVCSLLSHGLTDLGYEVVAFGDPRTALDRLSEVKPDVVITDLDMPEIDGRELVRRLRRSSAAHVPAIILTANEVDAPLAGFEAGADDYVRKGTQLAEIAARVDAVVRRASATERMRKLFARYTSDAVVDQIVAAGDVALTGEKREVTILFVDMRAFTSFAESHDAIFVMATLNDVLGRLADAVFAFDGIVDKFLGDGLMAVFGAPVSRADDARRAVFAARQMVDAIAARTHAGANAVEIGVGINTGTVIAGSIGNLRRTEYTCIGDAVNVAARLCALAEPGQILVGADTAASLGDGIAVASLPPVRLKGKAAEVAVFRVTE